MKMYYADFSYQFGRIHRNHIIVMAENEKHVIKIMRAKAKIKQPINGINIWKIEEIKREREIIFYLDEYENCCNDQIIVELLDKEIEINISTEGSGSTFCGTIRGGTTR